MSFEGHKPQGRDNSGIDNYKDGLEGAGGETATSLEGSSKRENPKCEIEEIGPVLEKGK